MSEKHFIAICGALIVHFKNVGSNLSTDILIHVWKDDGQREQLGHCKSKRLPTT